MKNNRKRFSSTMLLVVAALLSTTTLVNNAKAAETLVFASDIQGDDGKSPKKEYLTYFQELLTSIIGTYPEAELVGLSGDYNRSSGSTNTTSADFTALTTAINTAAPGRARVFAEGNHDASVDAFTHPTGLVTNLGGINSLYDIYVINWDDFDNFQNGEANFEALENYLKGPQSKGKVVFILSHYPLQTTRTSPGGSAYRDAAPRVFDLLQECGGSAYNRDIVYLWGHNHSSASYDNNVALVGAPTPATVHKMHEDKGEPTNSSVNAKYDTDLNFFHVAAGYVKPRENDAYNLISATVIKVDHDTIKIRKYGDEATTDFVSYARKDKPSVYRMTVLDSTGSMEAEHEPGVTRLDAAKEMAKNMIPDISGVVDALWVMTGDGTYRFPADSSFTDAASVRTQIEGTVAYDVTPLADTICRAMDDVEAAAGSTGTMILNVFTDGEENASDWNSISTVCATSDITSYPNTNLFTVDARYAWGAFTNTVPTSDDRDWIPNGASIPNQYFGRAFMNGSTATDWSAGVRPGSWEWLVYHKVGRPDLPTPTSYTNASWPVAGVGATPVVMNFYSFYSDIVTTSSALTRGAASTKNMISVNPENVLLPKRFVRTAALGDGTSYDRWDLDNATFSGLAELTDGRFVPMNYATPIPLYGDLDGDGDIDETDLRIVLAWFGRPVDYYNQPSIDSDLLNDGFITNLDIAVVRANWTDTAKDAPIPGDIDYNWCVDEADLNQVMQWYGQPVNPGAQHSYHADMNGDGFINANDVAIVNAHMYEGCINHQPTCSDNIENGDETDIDCGGDDCTGCEVGEGCLDNSDCLSNACTDFVCVPGTTPAGVTATLSIDNNWGTGYCGTIQITNNTSLPTTSWTVTLNTNGSTINTKWNGEFVGVTGAVTATPKNWNRVIAAGQTLTTAPGFCAATTGGVVASVTGATGTF